MPDQPDPEPTVLTEQQQRDVATFWPIIEQLQETISEATEADLAEQSGAAALFAQLQSDDGQEDLVEQALRAGDWHPLLDELRDMGASYAEQGIAFADWYDLVHTLRPHMLHAVLESLEDDPASRTAALRGLGTFLDLSLRAIGEGYLTSREDRIRRHQVAIAELSTPVLRLRDDLLLLPIVGVIDTQRSRQLTERLLYAVRDTRARVVVLDITGVAEVDTEVANRIIQAAEAARLMGATPIITGISPGVAQTLVTLGVDLQRLITVGDLQSGIERADDLLGVRTVDERDLPATGR